MTVWAGLIALGVGLGASIFLPVPQNLKTSFSAGQSLYALGEYEGAIQEYTKIVEFDSPAVRTDSVLVTIGRDRTLPVMVAAWYQLGNSYRNSGQHDKALDAYRQVVEGEKAIDEGFRAQVQFQMAETRFQAREFREAADEYRNYVELFPETDLAGRAFYYAGWSEFNDGNYDAAITTLRQMLERYPQDRYAADAQFRIAAAFFEQEDHARAIEEAALVLERYPNSPVISDATYLRAQGLDKLGRAEEAILAYRDVRGLYDRMFELLRGSFREGRNIDFEDYRQLFETSALRIAEILSAEGRYDEALQELIAVQETAEERFYQARVQMRIGDLFMRKGRVDASAWNDAWTAYNQVIELYSDTPYPPNAQYQKGEARYYAGEYESSREEYLKVLEDYPDSDTELRSAALYGAGWSAERMGAPDLALESYAQAATRFPRSAQAPLCLLRMARIHFDHGRIAEAIEAYNRVVDNYPDRPQAAEASYGLGLLYREEERFEEAIEAFAQVDIGAGETYVAALVGAANILVNEGRDEEGREILNRLLDGVSGDPALEARAHFQIAQLDLNNRNYGDALARYTRVIDDYPDSRLIPDAYYGRALAYHWLGRYAPALEDYRTVLEKDISESMRLRVQFSKSLSYAALDRDTEARELLNTVIAGGDENLASSARLQLISMAEDRDPREAIGIYEEMLETATSAEDHERILLRLASAYFRLNQYDQSIAAAQELIDLSVSPESVANALFLKGNSYFRSGELVEAISVYEEIIEQFPQIAWARNALFQIGISYNQLSSAGHLEVLPAMSEVFQEYYTRYPDDERAEVAYYYDAWARYRMGNWEDASEVFAKLAEVHPGSRFAPEALFRAGDAIFNMPAAGAEARRAKFERAMAVYQQVVDRYPNSEYVDDALYNKAWCLINLDRTEEAIEIFAFIVAEFPDGRYGPRSQFTLGDYYYGLRDYENAMASYNKFLELYPAERLRQPGFDPQDRGLADRARVLLHNLSEIDAYNLYAQGEQLFDQAKYREAMEIFREVQERYPDSDQAVNAAVNIGAAYMALEAYRDAGTVFQDIVEHYAERPEYSAQVDFARQQLQNMQEARVL